jgi:hypothetical protein
MGWEIQGGDPLMERDETGCCRERLHLLRGIDLNAVNEEEREVVMRAPFPRWLVPVGKQMEPVALKSGDGEELIVSGLGTGQNEAGMYRAYQFVLPRCSFCDLGIIYVPCAWGPDDFLREEKGLDDVMAPLQRIFFAGYLGADVRERLFSNVTLVLRHFSRLFSEWKYPKRGYDISRLAFRKASAGLQRNMALNTGQLIRFAGDEMLVALRIAGGGKYLKAAGY